MAIKAGTENKRNVVIAIVLFCILAYLGISQLMSGPPTPAPVSKTARPPVLRQGPETAAIGTTAAESGGKPTGPEAHKVVGSGLDPTLHLEKLAASESIEYAGDGRN